MNYSNYILITFLILFTKSFSQNAVVGDGFSSGWGGNCPTTGNADFSYLTASGFGTSYIGTFNANNIGFQYFRMGVEFDFTTSQLTQSIGSDVEVTPGVPVALNTNCTTNVSMYIDVSSTSYNYVFKTRDAGANPTGDIVVFEVQGDVRTISSVSQNPAPSDVFFEEDVTVTASLDGNLNSGQGVYLRYSTDNFSTSTVLEMTGSGTTYTATIPDTVNADGNTINYYVFTSGDGLSIASANADFFTINLNSNGGSNYSYSVRGEYITQSGASTWDTPASWRAGLVPPIDAEVIISHDLELTDERTAFSVTIENNASLTNTSVLNIQDNGSINNTNGSSTSILGEVNFNNRGTVTGEITFNDVVLQNGGVDFGTQSTIEGSLTINTGGFVDGGSPVYGGNSTLIYNTNTNYGRRSEWSNAGVQGRPHHVLLQNNTNLQMGFDASRDNITAEITGNLTIENGSELNMDTTNQMQADLIVGGNFTNHGTLQCSNFNTEASDIVVNGNFSNTNTGTVNLSTTVGNDLSIQGNFDNQGTFNFNNRAIFFTGGNIQTLTAENNFDIPFLIIDKTAGEVQIQQDIIISGTGGNALVMANESVLRLNEHQLQMGSNTDTPFSMSGNARIAGSLNARILFNSTNTTGTNNLVFSQDAVNHENYLSEFEMQGTGTVAISDTLNILRRFTLYEGTFNSNAHLTFKSSDSLTAVLPEVTGGSLLGDVRVERHFPQSNRAFRYISSSVTTSTSIRDNWQEGVNNNAYEDFANVNQNPNPGYGTHITGSTSGANGFDATMSGNKSLYEFDETNQTNPWGTGIDNTDTNTITAGKPYALMIRGDRSTTLNSNTAVGPATTLRTTGELAVGDQPAINSTINNDEFTLIGNPYQAQVDMSQMLTNPETNSTNFNTNYMWIWDPRIGAPGGLGGYAIVDLSSGNQVDESFNEVTPRTSEANQFLQPFQACMLQATGNSPSITFVEAAKRNDVNQAVNVQTFSEVTSTKVLDIELYRTATQSLFDAVKLKFSSSYNTTPSYEDAVKMWNNTERLAIVNENYYLGIDKRNLPESNDTVPLYLGNYQTNAYTLKFDTSFEEHQEVMLYDRYLNQTTTLQNGITLYDFSIDQNLPESYDVQRFALVFNPQTLSLNNNVSPSQFTIYPNPSQGMFYLQSPIVVSGEKAELKVYDALGRHVFSQITEALETENRIDLSHLTPGLYHLQVKTPVYQQYFKLLLND